MTHTTDTGPGASSSSGAVVLHVLTGLTAIAASTRGRVGTASG